MFAVSKVYLERFASWDAVSSEFGAGDWDSRTINTVEPEHVFAAYDQECYEGSALVVYKDATGYHSVEGSHCSCYGLEDQWKPHDETRDTIRHQATQANSYGPWAKYGPQIAEWLDTTGA